MTILLNAIPVSNVYMSMPRNGAWLMDCEMQTLSIPTPPAVGGPAAILMDTGGVFLGTVLTSDSTSIFGKCIMRIIAGTTTGLTMVLPSQNFGLGPSLLMVATALLGQAGLALNPGLSSPAALQSRFKTYTTDSTLTVAQELSRMCQSAGCSWRPDPTTGTITFVIDTYATAVSLPTAAVVESIDLEGAMTYNVPVLDSLPLPGTTMANGNNVNEVKIFSEGSSFFVQLLPFQGSRYVPENQIIDPLSTYAATVVLDNANGTMNIMPASPLFKGVMMNVPVSVAGPGLLVATPSPGAACFFSFANGDVSMPQVTSFASAAASPQPAATWTFGATAAATPLALQPPVDANFTAIQTYLATLATTINANFAAIATYLTALTLPVAGPVAGPPASPPPPPGTAATPPVPSPTPSITLKST